MGMDEYIEKRRQAAGLPAREGMYVPLELEPVFQFCLQKEAELHA